VSWRVPLADLRIADEDVAAVLGCLGEGRLEAGAEVAALERSLAGTLGVQYAVAVASGTAALHLACLAIGLGPGDEVIVPGLTFVATANAVRYAGAAPVLCEVIGADEPNIDPEDVARRITPRTRAVIAVHLFGYPAALDVLAELCAERGLALVEDCAQALGARAGGRPVGGVGAVGCLSFFSKKQLAIGEGGLVATDDERIASRVRALHALPGPGADADGTQLGHDLAMDEPRAALALSRLGRLERELRGRRRLARAYRRRLSGTAGIEIPFTEAAVAESGHFAFPVLLADRSERDRVRAALAAEGVQTTCYPALHRLAAWPAPRPSLPRVEEAADRHVCLPMMADKDPASLDHVVDAVRRAAPASGPDG
jgi:dTDP-4-amino-4,6-dideoxygalactose transaminase